MNYLKLKTKVVLYVVPYFPARLCFLKNFSDFLTIVLFANYLIWKDLLIIIFLYMILLLNYLKIENQNMVTYFCRFISYWSYKCDFFINFAQWRYSNQWSNREVLLLLVENYNQYPALETWNTVTWGNFWLLLREQISKSLKAISILILIILTFLNCLLPKYIKSVSSSAFDNSTLWLCNLFINWFWYDFKCHLWSVVTRCLKINFFIDIFNITNLVVSKL